MPEAVMLRRVRVYGFVDTAVNPEIGLHIAVDIEAADVHAAADRCLENRCLDVAALPLDCCWLADTDRNELHRDGAAARLTILARTTRWDCRKDPRRLLDDHRGPESGPSGTGHPWRGRRGRPRRCRDLRSQS